MNDEASDKVLAVEQEYNKKRRPIYSKRNEVIKKVPLFWQRTLLSHPIIADSLTDDDTAILEHMTEVGGCAVLRDAAWGSCRAGTTHSGGSAQAPTAHSPAPSTFPRYPPIAHWPETHGTPFPVPRNMTRTPSLTCTHATR